MYLEENDETKKNERDECKSEDAITQVFQIYTIEKYKECLHLSLREDEVSRRVSNPACGVIARHFFYSSTVCRSVVGHKFAKQKEKNERKRTGNV